MFVFKEEISKTIKENNLSLIEIEGVEKIFFIKNLYNRFIKNNPRALWLDFKYKPTSISYEKSIQDELVKLIPEKEDIYFVVDDFNIEYHIYKSNINDVFIFIEECVGLDEYYIVYDNFNKLFCENDHGELLFIDININEKR